MLRELSDKEQALVSGGQTEDELVIMELFSQSGSVESTGENSVTTSNGTFFYDSDGNGYWDHASRDTGDNTWDIYDPATRTWVHFEDIEAPPESDAKIGNQ